MLVVNYANRNAPTAKTAGDTQTRVFAPYDDCPDLLRCHAIRPRYHGLFTAFQKIRSKLSCCEFRTGDEIQKRSEAACCSGPYEMQPGQ
jgi:hypothetical protein